MKYYAFPFHIKPDISEYFTLTVYLSCYVSGVHEPSGLVASVSSSSPGNLSYSFRSSVRTQWPGPTDHLFWAQSPWAQHFACLIISSSPPNLARRRCYYRVCLSGLQVDGQKGEVSQPHGHPTWEGQSRLEATSPCVLTSLFPLHPDLGGSWARLGDTSSPSLHMTSSLPSQVI